MAILIIEMGIPPGRIPEKCGETAQWFINRLTGFGKKAEVVRPYRSDTLPAPETVKGAIITGSWAMVTDRADWSERTADWIRQAMAIDTPLLGVCYGHQLMADALGGKVGANPYGGEKGSFTVTLTETAKRNPLLDGFPDTFEANLFHEQSVLTPPGQAEILAFSEKDSCQMLRYGTSSFSVQFHPEFTKDILTAAWEDAVGEGVPATCPIAENTPWPRRILQNFCIMVEDIG